MNKLFNIGLDIRGTEPGFKSHFGRGTGRYASNLYKELLEISQDSFNISGLLSDKLSPSRIDQRILSLLPFGKITFETQVLFPKRVKKLGVDFIHFVAHCDAPFSCSVPYIITVLDLIPLKFPELYRADKANWRYDLARYLESKAIKGAAGFIAISEASKRDLVEFYDVKPEDVYVTPLAADDRFLSEIDNDKIQSLDFVIKKRKELNLPSDRKLLLYVGGIDQRKNINFLLEVIKSLKEQFSHNPPMLVLVGNYEKDKHYPWLKSRIKELELENDVILSGFVSDDVLVDYYLVSDLFVFASLYEGFGLPVLEAMSVGIPVVCANNSSIPEVVGDSAALMIDNFEVAIWVKEIILMLGNMEKRLELRKEGYKRAKLFSWKETATKTLNAYQGICSK